MTRTFRSPAFLATFEVFAAWLAADLHHTTTAKDIPALGEPAFVEALLTTLTAAPVGTAGRTPEIAGRAAATGYHAAIRSAALVNFGSALDIPRPDEISTDPT